MYEITKGFGESKVLRKPYRTIKVGHWHFEKVFSFLAFPLAPELRKILSRLIYDVE